MNVVTIAEEQYGLITRAQAARTMSQSAIDRRLADAGGRLPGVTLHRSTLARIERV